MSIKFALADGVLPPETALWYGVSWEKLAARRASYIAGKVLYRNAGEIYLTVPISYRCQ